MNMQNNEGFTPLLYASYNGHMDVIRYLIQQYAVNQQLTTKTGLNAIHLAAQNNKVFPILFFKDKIDLNSADTSGSSCLHWASYMNSEQALTFLLSCPDLSTLDNKDNEGSTPLMMAVMYGNTRIVRKLLLKGANRYIKNNAGFYPIQVAKQNSFPTIYKMLNEQYSCLDILRFYCNVKI